MPCSLVTFKSWLTSMGEGWGVLLACPLGMATYATDNTVRRKDGRGQRMILLAFVVIVVVIGILYAVLTADDVDRMIAEAIANQGPVPGE